jgi:hypothetical protein
MCDEAVDLLPSKVLQFVIHNVSQPLGDLKVGVEDRHSSSSLATHSPSRHSELDCVLYYRTRDLLFGFDLRFQQLLRADPCERLALPHCFGSPQSIE